MEERISYYELPQEFLEGLHKTEAYLKSSGLDLKLLELMKYRISQINGCAYCIDMHHKEAIHLGETELRVHSLAAWRECPFYDEKERAVLAFAEVLTIANLNAVEDEVYDNLSKFYSKVEIAILTLGITQINTWNRINKVFRSTPGQYKVGQFGNLIL
ncbi:MAG: carboxymuconolactone decarboxylase family protein [Cyclobacteriaceae bacterium]